MRKERPRGADLPSTGYGTVETVTPRSDIQWGEVYRYIWYTIALSFQAACTSEEVLHDVPSTAG
jgi:hypothetical protein